MFQAGRLNGNCIKFGEDDPESGDNIGRDVKDGRQFERDILIDNRETKYYHCPALDSPETVSSQSDGKNMV